MLNVDKIHTYYGSSHILFEVSLTVDKAEVVGLLGRNGAGKSTTLRSIMGLTPPKEGRITFNGEDITGQKAYALVRKGIGYVPDDRRIFADLNIDDNLEIVHNRKTDWSKERVYALFPALKEIRTRRGGNLSGGEQQMLTIARTLMGNPDLVLLDEPTEGLAPIMVMEVMKIVKELKEKGETILLVEQNSTLALSVSQRAYILENGHMVFSGVADDIIQNVEVRQKFLGV